MKKKLLFAILIIVVGLSTNFSFATTHTIVVGPSSTMTFSPATLNVALGDTIIWSWSTGSHTTTSDNGGIPAGAATWDQVMDGTHTSFMYVPTVNGVYHYHCTPHLSMGMVGTFTVATVSVNSVESNTRITITPNPATTNVSVRSDAYAIKSVNIYNQIGALVYAYNISRAPSNNIRLDVGNLPCGIYFVRLDFGEFINTQKLVIAR